MGLYVLSLIRENYNIFYGEQGVILGAFLWTRKDKIKENITKHRIKKLEKAGYTVIRNEDIVDETCEVCDEEVAD